MNIDKESYFLFAGGLADTARCVCSNLYFHAAGMNEGDEEKHAVKLARSLVSLRNQADIVLSCLDEGAVERAEKEVEDRKRARKGILKQLGIELDADFLRKMVRR